MYIWFMNPHQLTVFLADDDADDRLIFEEAMLEVNEQVKLIMAKNGEQLMGILKEKTPPPPYLIFLDLNMPLKNGFECLEEIKTSKKYKNIPVVVFSTTNQPDAIDAVYSKGADYYLCKPDNFQKLKTLLTRVFSIHEGNIPSRASRENFLINA